MGVPTLFSEYRRLILLLEPVPAPSAGSSDSLDAEVSMKAHLLLFASLGLGMLSVSCSEAPKGPQPGTPAFYWGAAKEMYHAGNYGKANDDVMEITRSENEFTAKARAMQLVLAAG